MSLPTIQVRGLSKRYRIGAAQARYRTLRETIVEAASAPFRRLLTRNALPSGQNEIWALSDVSFEVQEGEVVAIIGRNGAGKSTLLKILSLVTHPTRGTALLQGRVSSLLEVGTGFHPELTGRENVFLNGAIMGMTRREIRQKFDEIIAFAEVEKFIDTPVKRYSSGMQMRLAFAVAAHLEPEILVIDEVLAVGDAGFQRKCLSKVQDVSLQGRTVLIVSHNMPAVTRLCSRAILLDAGRLALDGPAHRVVDAYLTSGEGCLSRRDWTDARRAPGNDVVRLNALRILSKEGDPLEAADIRRPVGIEMEYSVLKPGIVLMPSFHIQNEDGLVLFVTADLDAEWRGRERPTGRYTSTAWIPGNFLAEGRLAVHAAMTTLEPMTIHFFERDAVGFHVVDSTEGDSARGDYAGPMPGVIRPLLKWTTQFDANDQPMRMAAVEEVAS